MPPAPKSKNQKNIADKSWTEDLVRALWLGLGGRAADLEHYLRRVLPKWEAEAPDLTRQLAELLSQAPQAGSPVRRILPSPEKRSDEPLSAERASMGTATDEHLFFEYPVRIPVEPVWLPEIATELNAIIQERRATKVLAEAGLQPTRTVIFTGLPGVGKTLAARWLARELGIPLAILNLGTVMSSFLGRSGANLRQVLAYASGQPCVLLLDELDAIAKRRDDNSDIGELKRLVTVLLQELDGWPSGALLVGATNHENLIDPAVWRRFERRIAFPLPRAEQQAALFSRLFGDEWGNLPESTQTGIAVAATRISPAEVTQIAMRTKREMIISPGHFETKLLSNLSAFIATLTLADRRRVGQELKRRKLGQREINRLTGLARETIRGLEEF